MIGDIPMKFVYHAYFCKEDAGYPVLFVDFECATQGDTLAEAEAMAEEAATCWIAVSIQQGEVLPTATSIEDVPSKDGAFVSLVCADMYNCELSYDYEPLQENSYNSRVA